MRKNPRRAVYPPRAEPETVPRIALYEPDARLTAFLDSSGFPRRKAAKLPDADKALMVLGWAHSRWAHDGANDPKTTDPVVILQKASAGARFRCVEYSIIAVAAARALGLKARTVGLRRADVETAKTGAGHVVAEIYLGDLRKWVMLDPQWARIPTASGTPLSAAEFAQAAEAGRRLAFLSPEGRARTDAKYLRWLSPYLFFIAFGVDQRFGSAKRGLDQVILVPHGSKVPEKFQGIPLPGKVHPAFSARTMY